MPRQARKYLDTSFFHAMVQGIDKEKIFEEDRYKNEYIRLIRKYLKEADLKIVSFCIMTNHAHFLINVKDICVMSDFMKKLNTSYAKYYNYMKGDRVGYVFRDRFKTEPIKSERQLLRCIKYIHQNPVKAKIVADASQYKYSSYNFFKRHILNHNDFSRDQMAFICDVNTNADYDFMDVGVDLNRKFNEGVNEFIEKENIKTFQIFEKSDILKKLISFLKREKHMKYNDILRRLDISKTDLYRFLR